MNGSAQSLLGSGEGNKSGRDCSEVTLPLSNKDSASVLSFQSMASIASVPDLRMSGFGFGVDFWGLASCLFKV
jgi:hypothetical protein